MEFYIDGKRTLEKNFWNSLNGLTTQDQVDRILSGVPVIIGGVKYHIVFVEED